jgi:DNA-binding transcriptional LysR family regulator
MNLRTLDLNLLLVFDAILRERSVIRAAKRLHLSQPALSHALNRLRRQLKDQLFVRTPAGMVPTPRTERLALPVRRALDELQQALEPDTFSPATAERRFVIAVNNYAAVALAAPLVARCRELAPRIRLSLRPSGPLSGTFNVLDLLERAELDLAILAADAPAERFASRVLLADRFVVVMRRGHPVARRKLDLATFAKLPLLVISSTGEDISFIDSALASHGYARSVGLEAPYLSAGPMLARSNMIAVLGRQIALEFRRLYPIEIRELPFDSPRLRSIMLWHRRLDDQPAQRWLRETTASVASAI